MPEYLNPNPILRNTVHYYWSDKMMDTVCRKLPDASLCIVFNFGDPVVVSTKDVDSKVIDGHFLLGPQSQYSTINFKNSKIFGVKFQQKGAANFIKESLIDYKNNVVPLVETPVAELASLVSGLKDTDKIIDFKKLLDYYLLVNVDMIQGASGIFRKACDLMTNCDVKNIKQVCDKCNCSNKHLISLFSYRTGLSPGLVLRINKFLKVIEMINAKKVPGWPQIALDCGYYDQAHLINEFKKFSGISPQMYLDNENAKGTNVLAVH